MALLRPIVSLLALFAGVAVAVSAARGFSQSQPDLTDELPLIAGRMSSAAQGHFLAMGYPWQDRREDLVALRRSIPPDPARPTDEELRLGIEMILREAPITMPARRMTWSEIQARLRSELAPHGVKVSSGEPAVPAGFAIDVPEGRWTGDLFLRDLHYASQKMIGAIITADGLFIGTSDACARASAGANLSVIRRSLAHENAPHRLDMPFRPDYRDAPIANVARGIKAQTGVDVVIDVRIWDTGAVVSWRGEPRPLRHALDLLCEKLGAFWRVKDGRVYVLVP